MKASEHFDLPLEANQESLYQSGGTDEWVAEFNTPEQAQIAARAINHADKLAEVLDECADIIALTPADRRNQKSYDALRKALDTLAVYRSAQ